MEAAHRLFVVGDLRDLDAVEALGGLNSVSVPVYPNSGLVIGLNFEASRLKIFAYRSDAARQSPTTFVTS